MKLQPRTGHVHTGVGNHLRGFVHKQQHRRDKSGQAACQFGRALDRDGAGARGVQHKTNGIDPSLHSGVDEAIAAIKRLPAIRRVIDTEVADDGKPDRGDISTRDIRLYLRTWPNPRVCLHRGERVLLRHRLEIPDEHGILILKIHFAYVPSTREHVIGWVEESFRVPFGETE